MSAITRLTLLTQYSLCFYLACGILATAQAQERAAGSTMETQMTWSALSTQVATVRDKANAVDARVNQIVICGGKGLVYAPGQTGSDADGCKMPKNDVDLTPITTNITNIKNDLTEIMNCGETGFSYNSKTKKCEVASNGLSVQIGTVESTSSYSTRDFAVKFSTPFKNTPKVYTALNRYMYHDNCREDRFTTSIDTSKVSRTGFILSLSGNGTCGGSARVESATWFAIGE